MHICLLNEFFYPDVMGGTPKVLSDLAARLKTDHGSQVTVITTKNSYRDRSVQYLDSEDWNGIKISRVRAPHWGDKKAPQRLLGNLMFARQAVRQLMRLGSCDVVLVSTAPVTLPMVAKQYLRRRGVPYVYIVYDLDPDRAIALGVADANGIGARQLKKHQRDWLHGAHTVIAIGRCMRDHLIAAYGLPPEKVVVVEVGADPDTVRPLPSSTAFRRDNGIEQFVVLYSGNFGKYHDFDSVLDAAKIVGRVAHHITFVLVGRGAKKAHMQARIAQEGIANVKMFDFVSEEDYPDLLASADISLVTLEAGMEGLCVPSKFYSILASGRPTLAVMRPNTEVAYTVEEANIGLCVDLGDSMALAHAIIGLSSQPEELANQGRRARQVFERKYSSDAVAAKVHNLLRQAARSKADAVTVP